MKKSVSRVMIGLIASVVGMGMMVSPAEAAPKTVVVDRAAIDVGSLHDGRVIVVNKGFGEVRRVRPLADNPFARQAFLSFEGMGRVLGSGRPRIKGGEVLIGVWVGCQYDVSQGFDISHSYTRGATSSVGSTTTVTVAPSKTVSWSVTPSGSITPGVSATGGVSVTPSVNGGPEISVGFPFGIRFSLQTGVSGTASGSVTPSVSATNGISGTLGSSTTVGGSASHSVSPNIGVSYSHTGVYSAHIKPGGVTEVILTGKTLEDPMGAGVQMKNLPVFVSGCMGKVQLQPFAKFVVETTFFKSTVIALGSVVKL